MKRKYSLIILFLIISIMIVSCTGNNSENTNTEKKDDVEYVSDDTYIDNIKISSFLLHTLNVNSEELRSYEKFIKEEYNIDLTMNITLNFDSNGANTSKMLRESPMGIYLYSLSNINQIRKLSSTEKILPLEEYLVNNKIWNTLPIGMKEMHSIGDDKV